MDVLSTRKLYIEGNRLGLVRSWYKKIVLHVFPRLCRSVPRHLGWCGSRMKAFVARQDAVKVAQGEYLVSLKVDGERVSVLVGPPHLQTGNHPLVFIGRDDRPFELIGRDGRTIVVLPRGSSMFEPDRGMLLDGELVQANGELKLCLFDCVSADSNFGTRPGTRTGMQPLVQRLKVLDLVLSWLPQNIVNLDVDQLPYYSLKSILGTDILAHVRDQTHKKLGKLEDDGLIFAPTTSTYRMDPRDCCSPRAPSITPAKIKWKPLSMRTMDFKIDGKYLLDGRNNLFRLPGTGAYATWEPNPDPPVVGEFIWNPERRSFELVRSRDEDKTKGNSLRTLLKVWESLSSPFRLSMLADLAYRSSRELAVERGDELIDAFCRNPSLQNWQRQGDGIKKLFLEIIIGKRYTSPIVEKVSSYYSD